MRMCLCPRWRECACLRMRVCVCVVLDLGTERTREQNRTEAHERARTSEQAYNVNRQNRSEVHRDRRAANERTVVPCDPSGID